MTSRPRLLALFVVLLVVPGCALAFLAARLLEQDETISQRTARERLEGAAELAGARILARLNEFDQRLPAIEPGEGAAAVTLRPDGSASSRGIPLLYRPLAVETTETGDFSAAEEAEFRRADYAEAIRILRGQLNSPARNGALLRIARNHRKAGRLDEAVAAYEELGTPAARHAACSIYEESRSAKLGACAEAMLAALRGGVWALDKASFAFHLAAIERWTGQSNAMPLELAVAEASAALWREWRSSDNTRGRRSANGLLLSWSCTAQECHLLAAGDEWVRRLFDNGVTLGTSQNGLVLDPARTHLPWPITVLATGEAPEIAGHRARRRLVWSGAIGVTLLVIASAYLILRAISRELAVARLQSEFVSAVSHEFRTPLTTLRHMTDILERGAVTEERRSRYYAMLGRETERLHRLVESLLDFGRMEAGRAPYRFASLDAEALVRELVDDFRSETIAERHPISISSCAGSHTVRGDREALSRAVWNLLDNAVKYSPGATPIAVETACEGQRLAIRVRDEGAGIPREELREIFRKFVRGQSAKETGAKGTGIGLAMVDHIARAHGGAIEVQSEPNNGSTFTLWLPLETEQ